MIISNCREEPFYLQDLINIMIDREIGILTEKQITSLKNNLELLLNDEKIPKEDLYNLISQIIKYIKKLNDTTYKYYKGKNVNKGTSNQKKRNRDLKKINNFQNFLLELYDNYVLRIDNKPLQFFNPPTDLVEQFRILEQLKENIITKGTIEYNTYEKPQKPNRNEIKMLFHEIEQYYGIKFNTSFLNEMIEEL